MTRNVILSALATVALAVTGPALAKPGKGGHGHSAAAKAKAGAQAKPSKNANKNASKNANKNASKNANKNADELDLDETGTSARAKGRANSQAALHASPRAKERANANSAVHGNTVVVGPLSGLAVGTPVRMGDVMGTVERIVPGGDRRVSNVLVRTSDGRIVPLDPDSLTSDGNSWSASSRRRGGSGR